MRVRPLPSGLLLVVSFLLVVPLQARQPRPLTFADLMRFRTIDDPVISDDGAYVAFTAAPDRGDGEAVVRATGGEARYVVPRGSRPAFSKDGAFVAMRVEPPFAEVEKAKNGKDKPKPGLALLRTRDGAVTTVDSVEAFAFSEDGAWLAYHRTAPKDTSKAAKDNDKRTRGAPLVLLRLADSTALAVPDVHTFAFDEAGRFVAYAVAADDSTRDGLYVRDLRADGTPETVLDARPHGRYEALAWSEAGGRLAFTAATEDADGEPGPATLYVWDGAATRPAATPDDAPAGWTLPADNTLRWTEDGERLFFGFRPDWPDPEKDEDDDTTAADPYDLDAILKDRTVDVWHTRDSLIIPNQKRQWKQSRERTYEAVYHRRDGRVVPLADRVVLGQGEAENPRVMLGRAEAPYYRLRTWEGFFFDPYVIRLTDGARTRIAEKLSDAVSLSPEGGYVVYYKMPHWYLYDVARGTTRNLTEGLPVPFADEDHDYPSEAPGYGVGGWLAGDAGVLIYDKYDIWLFPTDGTAPTRLTGGEGRASGRTFRIVQTDPEQRFFARGETVLLSAYHNQRKNDGFYRAVIGQEGVTRLLEEDKRFRFLAKAKDADVYLFTREDYDEFPDLWVSDPDFANPRRITDLNAQLAPFAWGTSELIEWRSDDGIPLQGVIIKPGNYEPGKRYPVLVYFYRFMSQRLHEFNAPVVNHRPSFPLYASNGYLIFLPDVRFEIGRPGFSATKAIVPGVQKLIEMGLADPDAIGLHGHSWSGYQTAFIVTQTNLFRAAIAGAPVSNMTSAYSGIRWGSGLARQFQYEKTQSRLGGSLWEARDRYIDNSPVFFADRIHTPLLIIHGDDDGAVPWYQSIELYLALRRLGKEAVFLQYRGEDHHPATYANKLDWAMKMKEYFDHYLKGAPAPAWIEKGVPYAGE